MPGNRHSYRDFMGNGSLLMTPNILHHIAEHPKDNFTVIAMDNGAYGSTGNQPTATATRCIDLELPAKTYGVRKTTWAATPAHIETVFSSPLLPRFVHVLTTPGNAKVNNITLEGQAIKQRFMDWL